MTLPPPRPLPVLPRRPEPAEAIRVVDSASLLAGAREVAIQHGDSRYRLVLTAQGKLILMK